MPRQLGHFRKCRMGSLAQWMKCLLGKHKDLNTDPRTPRKRFRVLT